MERLRTMMAAVAISLMSFVPLFGAATAVAEPGKSEIEQKDVQKVHLVMDSSGSMAEPTGGGTTRIEAAKTALRSLIDNTPDSTHLGLRVYGNSNTAEGSKESCTDSKLVVPIGLDNRDELRQQVDKYKPAGWTPISYALEQAGNDIGAAGEGEQHTIVLVSDGEETCVPDPCPVADKLAAKGIDLTINVVGLNVSGKAREQLTCIADHGNGKYYDAENADELEDAINDAALRSGQHFLHDGDPITGADSKSEATPAQPGVYNDVLTKEKDRWYRITKSDPGSTIWASALIQAETGNAGTNSLELEFYEPQSDDDCAYEADSAGGVSPVRLHAVSLASTECDQATELLLKVNLDMQEATELPYRLTIVEEAPVTNQDELPAQAEKPKWQEMPKEEASGEVQYGSASFADAPVLKPGAHSVAFTEGEVQIFAVDVDWGQRLQVQSALDASKQHSRAWGIDLISQLGTDAAMNDTDSMDWSNDEGVQMRATTYDVRYNNRGGIGAVGQNALSGRYYIVVSGGNFDAIDEKQEEVKGTLQIEVIGNAGDGAPAYAELESTPTPTPQHDDAATANQAQPRPEGGQSGTNWALIGGLGGGAVLCAAVGITALVFRNRARQG